jgi:hypothetical protein
MSPQCPLERVEQAATLNLHASITYELDASTIDDFYQTRVGVTSIVYLYCSDGLLQRRKSGEG